MKPIERRIEVLEANARPATDAEFPWLPAFLETLSVDELRTLHERVQAGGDALSDAAITAILTKATRYEELTAGAGVG